MKGYLTAKQIAELWDITDRQVQILYKTSRIKEAEHAGRIWLIPDKAVKPTLFKPKNKQKEKKDIV